ncbi:NlpC/P60 family protein [[Clostridium] symbiosum]|uniref:C40 family peptidase n=1 Tax=Clostridium symbiosum TaxID=1512 RepID=UPI001D07C7AE|nr:NlpC/P60 family protein [[Clostridium] symbiosum]MCB6608919.1 NlpC/P60 family protein [[Clostridium] symbiosum]MCB6930154.1 NlpC/P60 family protein [[Clostridium] symbiosum]
MRKFHPLIMRILVMTASGFLLISIAGTYTPSPSLAPPQVITQAGTPEDTTALHSETEPLDVEACNPDTGFDEKSLPVRIMDAMNRFAGRSAAAFSGINSGREEEYSPSVFKYNLMALYPQEQELSPADETASERERVLRLLKHNLKPFYDFFRLSFNTRASDSYGGRMYEYLNRKDAEWTSGLYKWLQASPEQAAKMLRLSQASVTGKYDPTNEKHDPANASTWLIPSWKNVNFNFFDGDGRRIDLYSNSQEIASMASVYTWYTGWNDVDNFRNYIDELWQLSHGYSVAIGPVYYCDGCVDPHEADTKEGTGTAGGSAEALSGGAGVQEASEAPSEAPQGEQAGIPSSVSSEGQNGASDASVGNAAGVAAETAPQGEQETVPAQTAAASAQPADASQTASQGAEASPSELSVPADGTAEAGEGGANASGASLTAAPEIQLNSEGKFCPGHVDLTVTARIVGLSERKNLYTIDKKGAAATDTWPGWSPYNKAYVDTLYSQDWSLEYELSPVELALGKPLTFSEISDYLKLLPADISRERKAVITYALHSVGKIPYYYGGKAHAPGYEGNNFANITSPDRKGRIISGLDCSGWVNWVYWSSLGKVPTNLGTSGLIHAGRGISRSELQPGDIIVRLGANSHVMMFLAWAPGGQMVCIHETGGSVSNVTVSIVDARWPYYRALLD